MFRFLCKRGQNVRVYTKIKLVSVFEFCLSIGISFRALPPNPHWETKRVPQSPSARGCEGVAWSASHRLGGVGSPIALLGVTGFEYDSWSFTLTVGGFREAPLRDSCTKLATPLLFTVAGWQSLRVLRGRLARSRRLWSRSRVRCRAIA